MLSATLLWLIFCLPVVAWYVASCCCGCRSFADDFAEELGGYFTQTFEESGDDAAFTVSEGRLHGEESGAYYRRFRFPGPAMFVEAEVFEVGSSTGLFIGDAVRFYADWEGNAFKRARCDRFGEATSSDITLGEITPGDGVKIAMQITELEDEGEYRLDYYAANTLLHSEEFSELAIEDTTPVGLFAIDGGRWDNFRIQCAITSACCAHPIPTTLYLTLRPNLILGTSAGTQQRCYEKHIPLVWVEQNHRWETGEFQYDVCLCGDTGPFTRAKFYFECDKGGSFPNAHRWYLTHHNLDTNVLTDAILLTSLLSNYCTEDMLYLMFDVGTQLEAQVGSSPEFMELFHHGSLGDRTFACARLAGGGGSFPAVAPGAPPGQENFYLSSAPVLTTSSSISRLNGLDIRLDRRECGVSPGVEEWTSDSPGTFFGLRRAAGGGLQLRVIVRCLGCENADVFPLNCASTVFAVDLVAERNYPCAVLFGNTFEGWQYHWNFNLTNLDGFSGLPNACFPGSPATGTLDVYLTDFP
ncbi:MAG: hypothetical protein AB7G12_12815 [Thermoanaerobaculia bacterium]